MKFLGVAPWVQSPNDVIQKIEKTLHDQYPHKQTNNGFLNIKNLNNTASKLKLFFSRKFYFNRVSIKCVFWTSTG